MDIARIVFLGFLTTLAACQSAHLERVRVSDDQTGFVLTPSNQPFTPWGHNYGSHGRLIEDFWATDWATLERDFADLHRLGTNVVRVHLQFGKFMDAPNRPNAEALASLRRLLALAERNHLYLDLTGLACYRTQDVPKQYDDADETTRWAMQANFWSAIARTCRDSPAVFCYDLMNEPIAPGQRREPGQWYSGALLGGYDFIQFITLDPAGRRREDVPAGWIRQLTVAIRHEDKTHLITVGMLPWDPQWHFLSGFVPSELAPQLDFICVHVYPKAGKVDEAMEGLRKFAVGKPLVIEETFPLSCGVPDERQFLLQSRGVACGWIGHYDGDSIESLRKMKREGTIKLGQAMYLGWLELFVELGPEMRGGAGAGH